MTRRNVFRIAFLASALAAACVNQPRPGQPTTTTSAPIPPGRAAPANPAEAWTTSGGPASPGAPSSGTVVDPSIEPVHDGGVW